MSCDSTGASASRQPRDGSLVRFAGLTGLAVRNVSGSPLRSWLIGLCALLIAGFLLSTVLVVRGAQDSLHLALDRLGADIVVVPRGAEGGMEGALLMGTPAKAWMPSAFAAKIAAVPGVAAASPQLYLESLANASCCSVSSMFMLAYDPRTDFTVTPWLHDRLGGDLGLGQAVGGADVYVPADGLKLYGYRLALKGNLEATGTNLDQSLFVTFQTAYEMARRSMTQAVKPLVIPKGKVSSVMVKLRPGADPEMVAWNIMKVAPGTTPVMGPVLFGAYRTQISGLLRGLLVILAMTLALAFLLLALVYSMAAHERRRQIGVLRALGATRSAVLLAFLTEASILALAGGAAGAALAATAVFLFRSLLVKSLGFPFLFPSAGTLAALIAGGLALALGVVALAALLPALRISRQEPADSMRE